MRKSITFLTILKQLITADDITTILKKFDYIDTARKFTVSSLLDFYMIASANQWKSFRHGSDVISAGLKPCNYSTVSKKASHVPFEIFKEILSLAMSRCNRSIRRATRFPKELLLVDSTTITVGKNRLPWAPYHGERSGVKLHIALEHSTNNLEKVFETTGLEHDSPILDQLVDKRYILVADRAYLQIKRSDFFVKEKQSFVIRIKNNVELSHRKSLKRLPNAKSNVVADFTCKLGTVQNRSDKRHRVVEFVDYEGKTIRVVTDLFQVTAEEIAAMYKARWGVELFFRWIKQNLNVPRLFGTTKNAVFNQLFASLIAYVILNYFYNCTKKNIKTKKLSLIGFTRILFTGIFSAEWQVAIRKFYCSLFLIHQNVDING